MATHRNEQTAAVEAVEAAAQAYGFTLYDVWHRAKLEGLNDWAALNSLIDELARLCIDDDDY